MDVLIEPLSPDTINGDLWAKGRGSKRLGSTPLLLNKLTLSYDLKKKCLTGTLVQIVGISCATRTAVA